MNSYYMLQDVRSNIGEGTGVHWTDREIMRKLNMAHRKAANILLSNPGDWLVTSGAFTPVDSVITLPYYVSKPVYLEETSSGYRIPINTTVRDRRLSRLPNTNLSDGELHAYMKEDAIVVNRDSYTTGVTLWYQRRVVDMVCGIGDTSSGAKSLIVPTGTGVNDMEPSVKDDYYNDLAFEVVVGTGIGDEYTIDDYDATTRNIITLTGTFGTDTEFGSVPQVPEEGHDYMVLLATVTLLAKPSSALDPKYFDYFKALLRDAKKEFEEYASSRTSGSNRTRITEMD